MSRRLHPCIPAAIFSVSIGLSVGIAAQQPKPIELDATTLAARTQAARSLVPLLEDVKKRATAAITVQPGGAPPSPFTGQQSTLLAFTLSKRPPVDPRVVQAMDRLLTWTPGDRSDGTQARLFDEWLNQLSLEATGLKLQTSPGACDTACVVETMTQLDETWGQSPRDRAEQRDGVLLDALAEAVKRVK
ncbi:MAG: penicillin acylase family protein [Acidobacteria bacterium]|nr:penicillin acylase family protein [Acidobacteriota bacterium]